MYQSNRSMENNEHLRLRARDILDHLIRQRGYAGLYTSLGARDVTQGDLDRGYGGITCGGAAPPRGMNQQEYIVWHRANRRQATLADIKKKYVLYKAKHTKKVKRTTKATKTRAAPKKKHLIVAYREPKRKKHIIVAYREPVKRTKIARKRVIKRSGFRPCMKAARSTFDAERQKCRANVVRKTTTRSQKGMTDRRKAYLQFFSDNRGKIKKGDWENYLLYNEQQGESVQSTISRLARMYDAEISDIREVERQLITVEPRYSERVYIHDNQPLMKPLVKGKQPSFIEEVRNDDIIDLSGLGLRRCRKGTRRGCVGRPPRAVKRVNRTKRGGIYLR